MKVTDQKTDCELTHKGKTISVFMHLIEVRYSDQISFWMGVAQLTLDDFKSLGELGPSDTPIFVKLPDGRTGGLYVTHGNLDFRAGYYELAGVGKPN